MKFQFLLKFLHFQKNEDPQYNPNDPQKKRLIKKDFSTVHYLLEHITVDESWFLYKGKLMLKKYIRTKRTRFGRMPNDLASAEGILLDCLIHQGNLEPAFVQPPGNNWQQMGMIALTFISLVWTKDILVNRL